MWSLMQFCIVVVYLAVEGAMEKGALWGTGFGVTPRPTAGGSGARKLAASASMPARGRALSTPKDSGGPAPSRFGQVTTSAPTAATVAAVSPLKQPGSRLGAENGSAMGLTVSGPSTIDPIVEDEEVAVPAVTDAGVGLRGVNHCCALFVHLRGHPLYLSFLLLDMNL
jgi:hypothetical protein